MTHPDCNPRKLDQTLSTCRCVIGIDVFHGINGHVCVCARASAGIKINTRPVRMHSIPNKLRELMGGGEGLGTRISPVSRSIQSLAQL